VYQETDTPPEFGKARKMKNNIRILCAVLFVASALRFFISLFVGRYPIPPVTILKALFAKILPIEKT